MSLNINRRTSEHGFVATDRRWLSRVSHYLKPHRALLLIGTVSMLVTAGCQVEIPDMIRRMVVAAAEAHDMQRLDRLLIAFMILILAGIAFNVMEDLSSVRLGQTVILDIRRQMFSHLQALPAAFMDQTHVGHIMTCIQSDVSALQESLENSIGTFRELVVLVGITAVLLNLDWKLGLLTLTLIPMLVIARALWLQYSKPAFDLARETCSVVNRELAENINGIRTVQEGRREAVNFSLYEHKARSNQQAQIAASAIAQIIVPTVDGLTGVAMAMIIVFGGEAVLGGSLDVAVLIAFIFYGQRFFDPVRALSVQYTSFQRAVVATRRIFQMMDTPITITDRPGAEVLGQIEPTVEFRGVTFGYVPGCPVLRDISFKVSSHEVVALVGATGSGKTSIAALLNRFYEADRGQVLVGGRDVRNVTRESLSRRIGTVLQEPFLFTGSIEDNIRYNSAATHKQVIAAAQVVSAHDFIMSLPQGYATPLGQRGRNLSAGQRQLISFARALAADPQILILDEATANVDSFTERNIQRALRVLLQGRTCIIIAHRLSTIREADRIIVLQSGRIEEQGTHAELLARQGVYAHLCSCSHTSFDDAWVEARGGAGFDSVSVRSALHARNQQMQGAHRSSTWNR